MGSNAQIGTPLVNRRPPVLVSLLRGSDTIDITGTRVRGGTWLEDDVTQDAAELDELEEIFNITPYNQGEQTKCDLFPVTGFEPKVGDVLEESADSAALALSEGIDIFEAGGKRRWVVRAPINRKQFGKRRLIFSMTLYRGPALDTTQIESES
jgi:hypothetical protein